MLWQQATVSIVVGAGHVSIDVVSAAVALSTYSKGEAGAVRRKNQMYITSANICNKDFSSLICYIGSVVAQKTMWANYILIVRGT